MAFSIADRISEFTAQLGHTLKSLTKIAISARKVHFAKEKRDVPLYILGNGPSLRPVLDKDMEFLRQHDTMAVNFAANSPEFTTLCPGYYVLADPHFFTNTDDANVSRLIDRLSAVTWAMTLFVPATAIVPRRFAGNRNLNVRRFNFIATEGFESFENWAFSHKLGMPRPRNVLIPSIMTGIWLGYDTVYLLGADHTWSKTLSVDDHNHVVTVQPHFYQEEQQELRRIDTTYRNIPLHSVFESFSIAFRAYHRIRRYADRKGIRILNATPGSFIDAFDRAPIK